MSGPPPQTRDITNDVAGPASDFAGIDQLSVELADCGDATLADLAHR